MLGHVKFFNNEKGFGFIVPADGSPEVFFHVTECTEDYQMQVPAEGDQVTFVMGEGRDGRPAAKEVAMAEGADEESADDADADADVDVA